MKRVALYAQIVVLLISAAALVSIYVAPEKTDALVQATLWLAAVSSALGILNSTSQTNKDHV